MSKKNKPVIKNSEPVNQEIISNGLTDVIMGTNPWGSIATQVNQTDTFFQNSRTYLISNMRQILSQVYVEHGLIRALVDRPVDDAFRGGIEIKSSQLDADDIKGLQLTIEREGILEEHINAHKWARLYGGGGIVYVTGQVPANPLEQTQKALRGMEVKAVDMWELFYSQQNIDDETKKLVLRKDKEEKHYDFYGIKLHYSRVSEIRGRIAPSFIRPRLRGWGLSVVESVVSSLNQFLKTKNLTFEVLDEFKLDIFKIDGFNNALVSKDGTAKIQQRVQLANQQKNYQNALTMDAKDDHVSKQLNFTGVAEVAKDNRMGIACDVNMPITKLFGVSAAGFNSGEDDIENYNSMVEGEVRSKAKKPLLETISLLCMRDYGFIPDDLEIEFKPLRIMSSEQEEVVKTSKMNRILMAFDKGIINAQQAQEAINHGNLIDIKIDVSELEMDQDEEQATQDI